MLNLSTYATFFGVAAGVVIFIYNYVNNSNTNRPHSYGPEYRRPGGSRYHDSSDDSDDDDSHPETELNLKHTASKEIVRRPGPEDECTICCDHILKRNTTKPYCIICLPNCNHWFHQSCAMRLLEYHPACPNCRLPINRENLRLTPVTLIDNANRPGTSHCDPVDSVDVDASIPNAGTSSSDAGPQSCTHSRSRPTKKSEAKNGYREDSLD